MTFKMKGSAFKLGNVATKSALKHAATGWSKQGGKGAGTTTHDEQHSKGYTHDPNNDMGANNWKKKEERKEEMEGGLPMKSPLEHDPNKGVSKRAMDKSSKFHKSQSSMHTDRHAAGETHDKDQKWIRKEKMTEKEATKANARKKETTEK